MKYKESSKNKIRCPNCKKDILLDVSLEAKISSEPKVWVDVEGYEYIDSPSIGKCVLLKYKQILNMHNVRIADASCNGDPTFTFPACSFNNGIGVVNENWETKPPVTGGQRHWEVELDPNEI